MHNIYKISISFISEEEEDKRCIKITKEWSKAMRMSKNKDNSANEYGPGQVERAYKTGVGAMDSLKFNRPKEDEAPEDGLNFTVSHLKQHTLADEEQLDEDDSDADIDYNALTGMIANRKRKRNEKTIPAAEETYEKQKKTKSKIIKTSKT